MRVFFALTLFVSFAAAQTPTGSVTRGTTDLREVRAYLADGEYEKAEISLRALLKDDQGDARRVIAVKLTLADLLREVGHASEARELFSKVLAGGDLGPKERMATLSGLADIDCHDGRMDESLTKWNETLALARGEKDSVNEGNALRGLAVCWLNTGEPSRAEPLLRRSLKMVGNDPAAHPWDRASALTAMAQCYRDEGKFALAEDAFTRALAIDRAALGQSHPQVAFVMEQLAIIYASTKRLDQARSYAADAAKIMRDACGEDSLAMASSLAIEAEVEVRANNAMAAASKYALALSIVRKHPASRSFALRIMRAYSGALRTIHRSQEANALNAEIRSLLRNPA